MLKTVVSLSANLEPQIGLIKPVLQTIGHGVAEQMQLSHAGDQQRPQQAGLFAVLALIASTTSIILT